MPNRVTRWIRSGVELCMACLLPPDKDDLPPKAKKRKRRRFWMIRKKEKVQVDPGNKEGKPFPKTDDKKIANGIKEDRQPEKSGKVKDKGISPITKARPLPQPRGHKCSSSADKTKDVIKKREEKPRKIRISPNCKGCLNKEHNPRKIKARLSSKLGKEKQNVLKKVEIGSTASEVVIGQHVDKSSAISRCVVSRGDETLNLPQSDEILGRNKIRSGNAQNSKVKSVKGYKRQFTRRQTIPEKLKSCKSAWAAPPTGDITTADDGNESSAVQDSVTNTAEPSLGESLKSHRSNRTSDHQDEDCNDDDDDIVYGGPVWVMATPQNNDVAGVGNAEDVDILMGEPDVAMDSPGSDNVADYQDEDSDGKLQSHNDASSNNVGNKSDDNDIHTNSIDADPKEDSSDDVNDIVCQKSDIALTTPKIRHASDDQAKISHKDNDDIVYGGPVWVMTSPRNDAASGDKHEDNDGHIVIEKTDFNLVTSATDDAGDEDEGVEKHYVTTVKRRYDIVDKQDEDSHDGDDDIMCRAPVWTTSTPRNDYADGDSTEVFNDDILFGKLDLTPIIPTSDEDEDNDADIVTETSLAVMATPGIDADDQDENSLDDDDDIMYKGPTWVTSTPRNYYINGDTNEDYDDDITLDKLNLSPITPTSDEDEDKNRETVTGHSSAVVKTNNINTMNSGFMSESGHIASVIQGTATVLGEVKSTSASCVNNTRTITETLATTGLSVFERTLKALSSYGRMAAAKTGMPGQAGMGPESAQHKTSADGQHIATVLGEVKSTSGSCVNNTRMISKTLAITGLSMFERPLKALSQYDRMAAAKTGMLAQARINTESAQHKTSADGQHIATVLGEVKSTSGSCVNNTRMISKTLAITGLSMFERPLKALSQYDRMAAAKTGMLAQARINTESAQHTKSSDGQQISNQVHSETTNGLFMCEQPRALSLIEIMTGAKTGVQGHGGIDTSAYGQQTAHPGHSEGANEQSILERRPAFSLYEIMTGAKTGMVGHVGMDTETASVENQLFSNQSLVEQDRVTGQSLELGTKQKKDIQLSNETNPNQQCRESCSTENKSSMPGSGDRSSEGPSHQTDMCPGSSYFPNSRQPVSHNPCMSPHGRKSKAMSDVVKTDVQETSQEPAAVTKVKRRLWRSQLTDDDPLNDLDLLLYGASKMF